MRLHTSYVLHVERRALNTLLAGQRRAFNMQDVGGVESHADKFQGPPKYITL